MPWPDHYLYMRRLADVRATILALPEGTTVVHGDAAGVDRAARDAALERGLPHEAHPPQPDQHGGDMRAALLARNAYVTTVDRALFWPSPESRGMWHAHRLAMEAKVPGVVREIRPLRVWTVRIPPWDTDAAAKAVAPTGAELFDVTRGSGGERAHPFAPSWEILNPAIEAKKAAQKLRDKAEAKLRMDAAWATYEPLYRAEMRESWGTYRAAWDAMMVGPDVAIGCGCADPARCHRSILAGIFGVLGAKVMGEIALGDPAR